MKVGAVDIGTNSMRLLVVEDGRKLGRWVQVTGLGIGVDSTGRLSDEPMARSIAALRRFGEVMDSHDVVRRAAIATSASRDASNREQFFDAVEDVIGVRPTLIGGDEEARFAYAGATQHFPAPEPVLVSDIGGGSTEFVTAGEAVSIDIGSVRLTERALPDRPASPAQLKEAREHVAGLFAGLDFGPVATLIGVAGTWTEIPVLVRGPGAERDGAVLTSTEVTAVVERLAGLRVDETAAIPGFNPGRAPVILGGVVVAEAVLRTLGMSEVTISIRDTMDGVAATLLALP